MTIARVVAARSSLPVQDSHERATLGRHFERSEAIHLAARRKEDGLLRCARNDVDRVSHTTSTSRFRRVGKGALAPYPPCISSVALDGGHAALCPPYKLRR